MSRQYKRDYELNVIGNDGEVRIIRDLRVSFEVTKSLLSFPNLAKIVIYNPNVETIAALQSKFTKITLSAGYEGSLSLIFKGELRNVFQGRKSVDNLITIYAGDGEKDWQNASFNKTFSANVSVKAAILEILKTFKEQVIGVIEGVPDVADKLRGQTLSGASKDLMDNFAEEYSFNWSIQDGEIIITPIEDPTRNDEAVLINSATGMIGSPTITEIGADATTLLNPRLLPNKSFQIESFNAEVQLGNLFFRDVTRGNAIGVYKVQEVVFKGDSREGDWLSMVKGRSVNGP